MIKTIFDDTQFQIKHGTEKEWVEQNPILAEGEEGVVFSEGRASYSKIGDGKTKWNDLPIFHGLPGEDGKEGYTPIKGIDYTDGKDSIVPGPRGPPGAPSTLPGPEGSPGRNGRDGKDGQDGESIQGEKGDPGPGLPPGGQPGQVPVKKTKEDYDTEWQYPTGGVMWTGGNSGGGASALDDLTDVVLTAPIADEQVLQYDTATGMWINATNPAGVTDHGLLTGLADDDHTQYIKHSLATAANDFLVASGVGVFVKKTLAEVKTALGLGTAAYTAATDYATAAHNHDLAYLGLTSKAADADKLDNHDSAYFATDSGVVHNSLFDANTILAATTDNTPAAVTVGEQTLLGRITSGAIAALSIAQIKTLLGYTAGDIGAAPANPLATDSLWDAAGDLVIGTGANTAGKLTKGDSGKVLTAGATTLSWETPTGGGADPATATPLANGIVGLVGTTTKYAREDHVHPGIAMDPIGVEWDPSFSASCVLQRVDTFGNQISVFSPILFSSHPTYAGIRRVNLADNGTVNAVYGDAGFKVDGSNGQVMVQVPKFWYKATKTGTRYQWLISSSAQTGFVVHPAFIKDTGEKDYFYLSAFEGSVYDVSAAATEVNTIEVTHVPTSNGNMVLTINTGPAIGVSVTTADSIENIVDRIVALGVQVDAFGVTWTPAKTNSSTLTYTASVARAATTLTLPTAYGVTSTITKTTSGAGGYLTADNAGVDVTATTGDKLCSVAAVKPASSKNTNITLPSFRILAHNRGSGWELQTFNQISAIQLLYLVEYANFDTQSVIGAGVSAITDDGSTNMAIPTGYTAGIGTNGVQLGNTTGECPLVVSGAYAAKAMSYRGVENFYGNIWKWVDGINIKADRQPWIADHDYVSDQFSHPYVNTGLANGATDGYISNIGFNSTMNYGFIPSAVGGSSSTYIPDYYYQTTGNKSALLGGAWVDGAGAGAFGLNLSNAASLAYRSVGARISWQG